MFGRFKKKTKSAPIKDDGLTRVIPKEIFEGEMGDFLSSMGINADDPGNILDMQAPPTAHIEANRQEFQHQWAQINQSLPFQVAPIHLLPVALWEESEVAWFMATQLNLFPYRPWNTIFLPVDTAGAAQCGLPEYFSISHEPNITEAVVLASEVKKSFAGQGDHITIATTHLADSTAENFPQLFPVDHPSYSQEQQLARRRIRALAFMVAIKSMDKDVVLKCQQTFLAQPEIQLIA